MARCPERRLRTLAQACAVAVPLLSVGIVQAQEQATRPGNIFTPTLSLSETYLRSSARVNSGGKGEFVTRVSPGLIWTSRAGRVQGQALYSLDASLYSRRNDNFALSNNLSGSLRAEVIDNWGYVDAAANISQRSVSAFGQQSGNDTFQQNDNRAEVATVTVSPYVQGSLSGLADYQVRLSGSATNTRGGSSNNSNNASALLSLRSPSGRALLGWGLIAQQQRVVFSQGRTSTNGRVSAELNFRPVPDLEVFGSAGQERTDVLLNSNPSYTNWGGGLRWVPSNRTNVELRADRRYFGDSYRVTLEHRTARTTWRYSASRDASSGVDPIAGNRPVTIYEILFNQFASSQPDPVLRDAVVRALLAVQGINPSDVVGTAPSLTSGVSLQSRQDLSVSWVGVRTTLFLAASSGQSSQLQSSFVGIPVQSFPVKQSSLTALVSYRLTPISAVNASVSRQVTPSNGLQVGNNLRSATLGYSTQLTRTISLGANARYAVFESLTDPYREASASASLNFRF